MAEAIMSSKYMLACMFLLKPRLSRRLRSRGGNSHLSFCERRFTSKFRWSYLLCQCHTHYDREDSFLLTYLTIS